MTPPSKELLSTVLGVEIDKVEDKIANIIEYWEKQEDGWTIKEINICKLAQQIKVWAFEQGYIVDEIGKYVLIIQRDKGVTLHRIDNDFYEVGNVDWSDLFDTSSVFKAGEWIINQTRGYDDKR